MLEEFLTTNRTELIDLCRYRAVRRLAPKPTDVELEDGIPLFLDQLIQMLKAELTSPSMGGWNSSRPLGRAEVASDMSLTAQRHGGELMHRGFTVDQVVHNYGDLCQAITGLAVERGAAIDVEEFKILNRCLDDGIAEAVTEFSYQRDSSMAQSGGHALNEPLNFFSHELSRLINSASLAAIAIKSGHVASGGATSALLDNNLVAMRNLADRTLAQVRLGAGIRARRELFSVAGFIAQVKIHASLEAKVRECALTGSAVDPTLAIDGDREMLFSAVGNLLHNALTFTRANSNVKLDAQASADRVLISVEDCNGGLLPGEAENLIHPPRESGADDSGFGSDLSICRRSVEANDGILSVRNLAGVGCIFTISLPKHALPAHS